MNTQIKNTINGLSKTITEGKYFSYDIAEDCFQIFSDIEDVRNNSYISFDVIKESEFFKNKEDKDVFKEIEEMLLVERSFQLDSRDKGVSVLIEGNIFSNTVVNVRRLRGAYKNVFVANSYEDLAIISNKFHVSLVGTSWIIEEFGKFLFEIKDSNFFKSIIKLRKEKTLHTATEVN